MILFSSFLKGRWKLNKEDRSTYTQTSWRRPEEGAKTDKKISNEKKGKKVKNKSKWFKSTYEIQGHGAQSQNISI